MKLAHKDVIRLIQYNPITGEFIWLVNAGRCAKLSKAGHCDDRGYIRITISGYRTSAHRLAWFYMYGFWPSQIDHIDGDKGNNKLNNLREVNHSQNQQNSKRSSKNTSGHKGVSLHKASGKWAASIKAEGRSIFLGLHGTAEDAHKRYAEAAARYFGEFKRIN